MKHIYNYDKDTGELLSEEIAALDPLETKVRKRNVFLLPAHATFIAPPKPLDGKIPCFDLDLKKWSMRTDLRGTVYFDLKGEESQITKLGKRLPKGMPTERPSYDLKDPEWDKKNKSWKESALVFLGHKCETKKRVDKFVTREIAALGEEKAKTLYLIAFGKGEECPEWDAFLDARQALLDEAEQFIIDNNIQ